MPRVLTGDLFGQGSRFGIVVARFNELVTRPLLDGAIDGLHRHGVDDDDIDVAWVPGAFEIPLVAKKLAETGRYAAVICLGAVIRGETDHYDYVAGAAATGIANVALSAPVPVIFGVLTCDTVEQALNRAGMKSGNKGFEAALTAIEMVHLLQKLPRKA